MLAFSSQGPALESSVSFAPTPEPPGRRHERQPFTETGFGARFRANLSQRPARLAAAFLVTVFAPAGLITNSLAGASPVPAAAPTPGKVESSVAMAPSVPSRAELWNAQAREAAATCPGLPAEVLFAIAHVETRLGMAVGPSSAGAIGPMQFLPQTWSVYGRDGDGDGTVDIMNPVDALHGAAGVLCANGGADPERLRSAVWNYNHSNAYVDEVLRVATAAL